MSNNNSFSDRPNNPYDDTQFADGLDNRRRAGAAPLALIGDATKFPSGFPLPLWQQQQSRYIEYWQWYTGEALARDKFETDAGASYEKYPLRINTIRNFARKKASLIFGDPPPSSSWLVRPLIKSKPFFAESAEHKEHAKFLQHVAMEVWEQSNGSTILMENATVSQFLGGSFMQLEYRPHMMESSLIPIYIKSLLPDFVLPIWNNDMWDLSECWITYRIPSVAVMKEFGVETDGGMYSSYVEHWTRDSYSIWIDNKPLVASYPLPYGGGVMKVSYDKVKNPFGFVPVFYIPRLREGGFWGPSIVPDLQGLLTEYNGRFADLGTIVQQTAHRRWFARNLGGNIEMRQFDEDQAFAYLGAGNPALQGTVPEIWSENPPTVSQYITENVNMLWTQMLREASLTHVHFGEDEGSQRSGETLEIRSWAAMALAKMERLYAGTGLNIINRRLLEMVAILALEIAGKGVTLAALKEYGITQQWHPMIERDRESTINEIVQLRSIGDMSLERSLETQGTVVDLDAELALIEDGEREKIDRQQEIAEATAPTEEPEADGDLAMKKSVEKDATKLDNRASKPANSKNPPTKS